MDRVSIVGASGAGKSTLARRLATELGAEHVELDALHNGPDWTEAPVDDFRAAVDARTPAEGRWVTDGNYWGKTQDLVWARADTIVFLDLPRWLVMTQLLRRSVTRAARREELWNGNVEDWRRLLSTDPNRNILLWSWTTHGPRRDTWDAAVADTRWSDVTFVRLRTRREVERLVATVT